MITTPPRKRGRRPTRAPLIVLAIVAACALYLGRTQAPAAQSPDVLALTPAGAATRITVALGGAHPYTVARGPGGYILAHREAFRLGAKPAAMFRKASGLMGERVASAQGPDAFGLGEGAHEVAIEFEDGQVVALKVGDQSPLGARRYAMVRGDPQVYLIDGDAFVQELNALHDLAMPVALRYDRIVGLALEVDGRPAFAMAHNPDALSTNLMQITYPLTFDADAEAALDLCARVGAIKLAQYVGAGGLDDPAYALTVRMADGASLTLRVGDWAGDMRYVAVDDSGDVYAVRGSDLDFLDGMTLDHLACPFATLVDRAKVDALTFAFAGRTYDLALDQMTLNGLPVSEGPVAALYRQMVEVLRLGACDGRPGQCVLSITFHRKGGGNTRAEYLELDGEYCALRRDGVVSFKVRAGQVAALGQAVKALTG